jgi:hypothetical protein
MRVGLQIESRVLRSQTRFCGENNASGRRQGNLWEDVWRDRSHDVHEERR